MTGSLPSTVGQLSHFANSIRNGASDDRKMCENSYLCTDITLRLFLYLFQLKAFIWVMMQLTSYLLDIQIHTSDSVTNKI